VWEYLLVSRKPSFRDEDGNVHAGAYYTFPELVEQFNKANATAFRGTPDGWVRHNELGSCHIKTLDGMCGVLIAHKLVINSQNVPQWYPLLEFMAQQGNYTYITMSNVVGDRLRAWKNQGFTRMLEFQNRRTLNNVELLIKKVPYEAA
jgi:hypothetical protein